MYYCSRSKNIPYSREKILERMEELRPIILKVGAQPYKGKVEMIGKHNFNHPVTELLVEYRLLMYKFENPPDPRGDKMYSRPGPWIEKAKAKEIALVCHLSQRTAYRAIQKVHVLLQLKIRSWVTVEEFCIGYELPIDDMQEKLGKLLQERWKRITGKVDEDDE
jgi:hypothetical protein